MTIREFLKKYPKIESDLLLAHLLKKPKEFLYIHPEQKLLRKQEQTFEAMAAKRANGTPVAYLLGYKYFYGLKFKVNKDVLIPRPESEWIIDYALKIISESRKKNFSVLDVGTGSGVLAITIRKLSDATVTASDISSRALKVAKRNAASQKVSVKFLQRDLLKNISQKFDLIIGNLPYVPIKEYQKLRKNLQFEPMLALVDPREDLALYKKFIEQLPAHLNKNACVILEIDPSYKNPLSKEIKRMPFQNLKFYKDIHGLWRFCVFNFPSNGSRKRDR